MIGRFSRGYLRVGTLGGAPVRIHLTTPLGLIVISGFSLAPAAWLGYFLLILVHELGHALVVLRSGGRVLRVDVLPFGGECEYDRIVSPIKNSLVAWGGVGAQALVLALATVVLKVFPAPPHSAWRELTGVLLSGNLILILVNLLPIPPLDGARAWALFPHLVRRFRFRRK